MVPRDAQLAPGLPPGGLLRLTADPFALNPYLQTQPPVAPAAPGAWLVQGHREVKALLGDRRLGPGGSSELPPSEVDTLPTLGHSSFLNHHAADSHARLRRLVAPSFTAAQVSARRARIEQLTDQRLDAAIQLGRMDVVTELARPVALAVATDLLGVDKSRRPKWGRLARELEFELFAAQPLELARSRLAMSILTSEIEELLAGWRERPPERDNVLWALELARSRGELSRLEVIATTAMLLFAGHMTTQHLIGNSVRALLEDREQWKLLCERPELTETAVEELVRFDPPAPVAPRTALTDIVIAGKRIKRGDSVLLLVTTANRDPEVFADPDRLDLTRSPNPHLGFGFGAHHCVGAALGRLEMAVVIGKLAQRVPDMRLSGDGVDREHRSVFHGLRSLGVLLT